MYIHVLLMIIYLFKIFHMSKKVISSLSVEDFERLSYMASYLLQLNFVKKHSSSVQSPLSKSTDFYVTTDDCVLTVEEFELLKKLKHLHVVEYGK